jgi:hypothetical protein
MTRCGCGVDDADSACAVIPQLCWHCCTSLPTALCCSYHSLGRGMPGEPEEPSAIKEEEEEEEEEFQDQDRFPPTVARRAEYAAIGRRWCEQAKQASGLTKRAIAEALHIPSWRFSRMICNSDELDDDAFAVIWNAFESKYDPDVPPVHVHREKKQRRAVAVYDAEDIRQHEEFVTFFAAHREYAMKRVAKMWGLPSVSLYKYRKKRAPKQSRQEIWYAFQHWLNKSNEERQLCEKQKRGRKVPPPPPPPPPPSPPPPRLPPLTDGVLLQFVQQAMRERTFTVYQKQDTGEVVLKF